MIELYVEFDSGCPLWNWYPYLVFVLKYEIFVFVKNSIPYKKRIGISPIVFAEGLDKVLSIT